TTGSTLSECARVLKRAGTISVHAATAARAKIAMAIFKKPAIKAEGGKKKEIPRGLFQKCPGCSEVVPEIEVAQIQRHCTRSNYHFAQPAKERIQNLLDPDSFVE